MSHNIAADKRLVRNSRVLEQRDMELVDYDDVIAAIQDPDFDFDASDTAILLSSNGELFELNLVASMIWEQLSTARTVTGLAAQVSEHFDIDHDTALSDVGELIAELAGLGLVEDAR